MKNGVITFILTALLVAIIGGFAGYYIFIKHKTAQTQQSSDIGDGSNASFGGSVGSTYQNIASGNDGTSSLRADLGKPAPRLWHVVSTPVAGFGFGQGPVVYIAERATGNILKADPAQSAIVRLTNTLIPKVREALFSSTGDVLLRTSDDDGRITTFAATVATTTEFTSTSTPNVLEGMYLPNDITAVDTAFNAPTSKGIFFVAKNPDGGSVGVNSGWKGTGVKKLFTSPLSQWRAQQLSDGRIVLTQNASDDIAGSSFIVNKDGVFTPLVSNQPGLTVLYHETGDAYLYGTSDGGTLSLYVKAGKNPPVKLPIATPADKCVWAPGSALVAYCAVPSDQPGANYLRDWYQGAVHTHDLWWKVDATTGTAEKYFTPDTSASTDVENPQVDASGTAIAFRNAADKSLWLLRISQ